MMSQTNGLLSFLTNVIICAFLFSPKVMALRLNTNEDTYDIYVDKTPTHGTVFFKEIQGAVVDLKGNWCEGDGCLTSLEREYLTEHAPKLAKGLSVLRDGNCMSPKRVITGGYFRTGSTLLFNQARLWMILAFPKGTAAGYDPDMTQFLKSASVVAKQHDMDSDKAKAADVLLMSRREVAPSVSSRLVADVYSFNLTRISAASRDELRNDANNECMRLGKMQANMYSRWNQLGKTVAYDVLLEDFVKDQDREIKAIAKSLGVCSQAREDQHLIDMVKFMTNALHSQPDRDPSITQMHPPRDDKHEAFDSLVNQLIKELPECNTWAQSHGNIMQNHFSSEGV